MWYRLSRHPWFLPAVVLLGMLMRAPTMTSGLVADDFLHWSWVQAPHSHAMQPGSPFGLFNFFEGGGHGAIQHLKGEGQLVWWAADDLRVSFWRPLSELTHWIDYTYWPDSPALMHLHSVLWYGLLLALLGRLYRRLDGDATYANLAIVLFTFSHLHLSAVSWIAARNQLLAGAFEVLAITAFHQWQSRGRRSQAWVAAGSLLLGLLSAEAATATMAYLVAYVMFMQPDKPWRQRALSLLPFFAVLVAWRMVYNHLGFGSHGSGYYVDPVHDPLRFMNLSMIRMPVLLLSQMFGTVAASINTLTPAQQMLYAAVAFCIVGMVWLTTRFYRIWSTPVIRFMGAGALLSLVPACASEPNDRLLLNAEIGGSFVLAVLFSEMWRQRRVHVGAKAKAAKVIGMLLVLAHLVLFPLQTLAYSAFKKIMSEPFLHEPLSLPMARGTTPLTMLTLNQAWAPYTMYYRAIRSYFGMPTPGSVRPLGNGLGDQTLTVIDDHTIEMTNSKGFYDSVTRDPAKDPFHVGQVVEAGPMTVTILKTSDDGVPLSARFHFDKPVHDPSMRFVVLDGMTGYKLFELPPVGQSKTIPGIDIKKLASDQFKALFKH